MVHSREPSGRKLCLMGVRVAWEAVGDGEFFCPECGGDRNYLRLTGRRRFTVLGVPLLTRGTVGPVVACSCCRGHFGPEVLDQPTSTRLAAMLRDGVHTIVLAVLAAGGTQSRAVRECAVAAVRAAGFPECTEDQLLALLAALAADTAELRGLGPGTGFADGYQGYDEACRRFDGGVDDDPDGEPGAVLEFELHEVLSPLAPHLAPEGRENLLLQGARVALADGLYVPAERNVLTAVGRSLHLPPERVSRLLTAARTPS